MSFAVPAPAQPARPSTVSLAVNLLYAAAGLELINTILALAYSGAIKRGTDKALEGTGSASNPAQGVSGAVGTIFGVLIIVLLVLLAIYVGRGKQVARILTWVLGGIALCCSVFAGGAALAGPALWDEARKTNPKLPTYDAYMDLVYSEVPGWYQPVTTVLSILLILALIIPIVLLALPSSHPYFRKVEPQWEPPTGGDPGYPGNPGYPAGPSDGPPPGPPNS